MNIFIILIFAIGLLPSFAQDSVQLGKGLYSNPDDQAYVSTFFSILKNHKEGLDPFLGGKGPSINKYDISKMKFAFLTNRTEESADLVIFNWEKDLIEGMTRDENLSKQYGSNVFILKGIDPKSIASQGENNDEVTNFSYVLGAKSMPDSMDWKPNPHYMEKSHPLRQALGKESLVLLSPEEELFIRLYGDTAEACEFAKEFISSLGGFQKIMIGVMIHEMFHVKEGIDQLLALSKERSIEVDRKLLKAQLDESRLNDLLSTYTNLVFKIGINLGKGLDSKELLGKLFTVINSMKKDYPEAWKFIWDFEYTEGFAEYASAQSVVDVKLFTLAEKIDKEIKDQSNNIAYRTGTLGGLYLNQQQKINSFENAQDHKQSVWEIILDLKQIKSSGNIDDIINEHKIPKSEFETEIISIKEYLTSTLVEV